jgi:hypothetical protein
MFNHPSIKDMTMTQTNRKQVTVPVGYDNTDRKGGERINPNRVKATGQAVPTGRLLDGSSDYGYAEEWQEPATMPDGRKCRITYLFDDGDICDDVDNYPFDADHVARIVLD